jgi:hypothetical protein
VVCDVRASHLNVPTTAGDLGCVYKTLESCFDLPWLVRAKCPVRNDAPAADVFASWRRAAAQAFLLRASMAGSFLFLGRLSLERTTPVDPNV